MTTAALADAVAPHAPASLRSPSPQSPSPQPPFLRPPSCDGEPRTPIALRETSAPRRPAEDFDISPLRWRAKKIARRAAVRLGQALRKAAPPGKPGPGSVRVLTYHRFGGSPLDPCSLEPAAFEAQLDWLCEHANVLTPTQFEAVMSGAIPAPPDAILITIDDGHESVPTHALPALDRRGVKAVLFVCPQLVGEEGTRRPAHGGFMSWHALGDASRSGHTIAPHGHSHRSLGRLPLADALADVDLACAALDARLGIRSRFFSFPFGTRADHSPALADALAGRGFRYCFTASHGRCLPGSPALLLPRIKIEGGNEQDLFPHIARGCIDHWRIVDDALFLLQQRGRM